MNERVITHLKGKWIFRRLRRPVAAQLKWVSRKAIVPTENELGENPRARSAQLRVMEKI